MLEKETTNSKSNNKKLKVRYKKEFFEQTNTNFINDHNCLGGVLLS